MKIGDTVEFTKDTDQHEEVYRGKITEICPNFGKNLKGLGKCSSDTFPCIKVKNKFIMVFDDSSKLWLDDLNELKNCSLWE